jgi:hypothetical protein
MEMLTGLRDECDHRIETSSRSGEVSYLSRVTTSPAGFTCGPCQIPAGKNSTVYLPAGSGDMMSRARLRHGGFQPFESFGGWPLARCEHAT